jgi:5-methylcytosine-specific restriction endonuclease McrA
MKVISTRKIKSTIPITIKSKASENNLTKNDKVSKNKNLKNRSNYPPANESLKKDWKTKYKRCGICGEFLQQVNSNIDHIIPKSKGGSISHPYNLTMTHRHCNSKKNNKLLVRYKKYINLLTLFQNSFFTDRENSLKVKKLKNYVISSMINFDNKVNRTNNLIEVSDLDRLIKWLAVYKIEINSLNINYTILPEGVKTCELNKGFIIHKKI